MAKVIQRLIDENGIIVARFDKNSEPNTLVYDVEIPDGNLKQYAANVLAMNILSQVDYDGHNSKTLYGIVGYKRDGYYLSKANAFITTNKGVRKLKKTNNMEITYPMEGRQNTLDTPQYSERVQPS